MTKFFKSSILTAASGIALLLSSCGDNLIDLLPDPTPEPTPAVSDAELLEKAQGIIELKDGIGSWDAAYLTKYGYFARKASLTASTRAAEDAKSSTVSFMSSDESEKMSIISNKEDNLPTQLVSEIGNIYFNYPNDSIAEVIYEKDDTLSKIADVEYSKEDLSDLVEGYDELKTALAEVAELLKGMKNSGEETSETSGADELAEKYSKMFSEIVDSQYTENEEISDNLSTAESGNYQFAETISEWYEEEIEETVCNALSLWTGDAVVDNENKSCTLAGNIWCPANIFNDYGTYGILCDENPDNLYLGKAQYEVKGYQSTDGQGFTVKLTDLKPGATYHYRTYYNFNTSDHGTLVPKAGNPTDQTIYDQTKSFEVEKSIEQKKVITVNGVSFTMIYVEGGTFSMGATPEQYDGYTPDNNVSPVHSETVGSFYMGETEVTQALWYAVMGNLPTSEESQWTSPNYPAYNISYDNCAEFIKRLNQLTDMNFRMPTEAEWEYAARGGAKSKGYRFSGSNYIKKVAWYSVNSNGSSHPVKTKIPNELGLYDMSGNVWEWCSSDWYISYNIKTAGTTDPTCPATGSYLYFRGGSWSNDAMDCRVAIRSFNYYTYRSNNLGLRLAAN